MKKHTVKMREDRKILLAYLKENMGLSSRKAKKLINKGIKLNGRKLYGDSKLKNGDLIMIEEDSHRDSIKPIKMDLEIIYEDDYLLAVNKPPYMVVHSAKSDCKPTLANGIRYYFDEIGIEEPVRFFNRIDMNTSGIVLVPKSSQSHSLLDRYSAKTMKKKYLAVVSGIPSVKVGKIDLPISDKPDSEGKRHVCEKGKPSITEYKVLEEYKGASLLSIVIKTGRTHQIRIHLSSMGHPLLGDKLYGGEDHIIKRHALHAKELAFPHPFNNKSINIIARLPADMVELLNRLKGEE